LDSNFNCQAEGPTPSPIDYMSTLNAPYILHNPRVEDLRFL